MNQSAKKSGQDINKKASVSVFNILGCTVFLGCLFIYFYKFVGIHLMYQRFALDPWFFPFEPRMEFFRGFLDEPGGVLSYIESFLFQWYYLNLSGALVAILISLSAYMAVYSLLTIFCAKGKFFLSSVPVIAVAVMFNTYYNMLYGCLGVVIAMFFAVVYLRFAPKQKTFRLLAFAITFVLLYYVIAGFSLMFVLIAMIFEVITARKAVMAFCYALATCIVVCLFAMLVCDIGFKEALLYRLSFDEWASPLSVKLFYGVVGYVLLVVSFFSLCQRFNFKSKANDHRRVLWKRFLYSSVQVAILLAIAVASIYYSFNSKNKTYLVSKYLARHSMWNELIELGQNNPWLHKQLFFNHDHNLALFHLDRLENELFKYPQNVDALLLSDEQIFRSREYYERSSSDMISMGYVNSAVRNSFELLEGSGNWPLTLKLLAFAHLAKGQDDVASVFLNRLSKDFLHGKEARDMLKQMRNDPTLSGNERIQHLRSVAVIEEDLPEIKGHKTAGLYQLLLGKNPKNKMAFQYMMAEYLLKEEIHKLAENIHGLDDFGYEKLPRYYEEALVIEMQMNQNVKIPSRWRPSVEALKRGEKFLQTYAIYKRDKAAARKILAPEYGDSYYYYFMLN